MNCSTGKGYKDKKDSSAFFFVPQHAESLVKETSRWQHDIIYALVGLNTVCYRYTKRDSSEPLREKGGFQVEFTLKPSPKG